MEFSQGSPILAGKISEGAVHSTDRGQCSTQHSVVVDMTGAYTNDRQPQCSSTPKAVSHTGESDNVARELGAMVEELGKHIGDTVTARILSSGRFDEHSHHGVDCGSCSIPGVDNKSLDLSRVNVILHTDVKEPPVFKGDGSEASDISEWVEMMQLYLRKRNFQCADQADEIMSRLRGRARDVVKIALRSDPTLDVARQPDVIYGILKQNFSMLSYSSMPLADFYSTLPKHNECPIDYWVRINKAADIADECLMQMQGKHMDDVGREVAMMFIRNCPDSGLAYVFKTKPIRQWTAKEVQERIDEFQREKKTQMVSATRTPSNVKLNKVDVCDHNKCLSDSPTELTAFEQRTVGSHRTQLSEPVTSQSLDRMTDMLSKVLDVLTTREQHFRQPRPYSSSNTSTKSQGCRICKDKLHTTASHCRAERLCFGCHEPGHIKLNCPVAEQRAQSAPTSSNDQSQFAGNEVACIRRGEV